MKIIFTESYPGDYDTNVYNLSVNAIRKLEKLGIVYEKDTSDKVNPKYTKAYFDLALCFDKIGKQREAKRFYHKFLELQPEDENANYVMHRMEKLKKVSPSCASLHLV